MNKKVLIVSQVIPQWYVDLLTSALPEGTHIDIITGSNVRGNVIASPVHNPKSFLSRLVCWAKHYSFMRKWIRQNKAAHYDLVFAVSNPPVNTFIGLKLKKVFKAPFVFMNWDIYPQFIDLSIKNPLVHFVCKLWNSWNNKNYKKIDKMLTIGNVVAESINADLQNKIDIDVIPIAVDTNKLKPIEKKDNLFIKQNGLEDKFIVLYSGKMGYGHNIELILNAAKALREHSDIKFVFIGDGQKYDLVKAAADDSQNTNVLLFPLQPDDIFPFSMACGDIGVVAEEERMAHLFMPSKTYSMMACGMAILGICSKHDDLYNLITQENIGCAVTDNDVNLVCDFILKQYQDKQKLQEQQKAARAFAETVYDTAVIQKQYKKLFEKYL
ncbi:MAG: glycosyltransferase family 4 protein [Clostridia bacterium]|nr:glycosyltransferase family 4 protein [Clostridia bacterium]